MSTLTLLRIALVEIEPCYVTLVLFANMADNSTVEHGRYQIGIVSGSQTAAGHDFEVEWIIQVLKQHEDNYQ